MDPSRPQPRPIQPDGRLHGVAVAVRREDGRLLMIRRARHLRAGGKVCFPGGAVEIGEQPAAAAIREMKEELGIAIEPLAQIWEWDSPTGPLKLFGFTARWTAGDLSPDPAEVAEVLWLTPEEGEKHPDALPTNAEFIEAVLKV